MLKDHGPTLGPLNPPKRRARMQERTPCGLSHRLSHGAGMSLWPWLWGSYPRSCGRCIVPQLARCGTRPLPRPALFSNPGGPPAPALTHPKINPQRAFAELSHMPRIPLLPMPSSPHGRDERSQNLLRKLVSVLLRPLWHALLFASDRFPGLLVCELPISNSYPITYARVFFEYDLHS